MFGAGHIRSGESTEDIVQLLARRCRGETVERAGLHLLRGGHHGAPRNPRQPSADTDAPHAEAAETSADADYDVAKQQCDARTGNETRGFPASAEYWHGLAAVCDFRGGKLAGSRPAAS